MLLQRAGLALLFVGGCCAQDVEAAAHNNLRDKDGKKPFGPRISKFFQIGDWGSGLTAQIAVNRSMTIYADRYQPDFVIAAGDNFYDWGVRSTTDPLWERYWNSMFTARSLQLPWYAILGNHDYYATPVEPLNSTDALLRWINQPGGTPEVEVDYYKENRNNDVFQGKSRWIMDGRYYTRKFVVPDGKTLEMLFIDTVVLSNQAGTMGQQNNPDLPNWVGQTHYDWIQKKLKESKADWLIVVGHYPIYSPSTVHGDNKQLIKLLQPLLKQYGVQAYINAHDHFLSHLESDGINYFVNGAGGKSIYRQLTFYETEGVKLKFSANSYGFNFFEFVKNGLRVRSYGSYFVPSPNAGNGSSTIVPPADAWSSSLLYDTEVAFTKRRVQRK